MWIGNMSPTEKMKKKKGLHDEINYTKEEASR